VPELAICLAIARQFESVERIPLAALQRLHVQLARATLEHPERARFLRRHFAREPDRDSRAESDVDQVTVIRQVHDRDPVGASGVSVPVVDDARQVKRHVKAEFGEHFEEESVLLEAIAAATALHDARIQRFRIQWQVVTEPRTAPAESELPTVTRRRP